MSDETEKKTRAPQTGMALETDVLRKIAHQLERLPTMEAKERAVQFVFRVVREGSTEKARTIAPTGQLGLNGTAVPPDAQTVGLSAQRHVKPDTDFDL